MMCIFLYLSFSIYFIYNLKPFPNASLTWRALKSQDEKRKKEKAGKKIKINWKQIFFPFYIYCDQVLNTTKTKRKRETTNLNTVFPKIMKCYFFKSHFIFILKKRIVQKKFLQWKQQVSVVRTLSSTVCFDTIKLYRSWALSSWGERRSWLFYIKQWHNVWFIRKFSLSWIPVNWETLTVHFVVQQASNLNLYSTNIHPISMSNIKEGQSGRCCLNTKKRCLESLMS